MDDPTRARLSPIQARWLIHLVQGPPTVSTMMPSNTKRALQNRRLMVDDYVTDFGIGWVDKHPGGKSTARHDKAQATRERLLDLMEEALEEIDWKDLRIRHITDRAGVSIPVFPSYFPSMTEALRAMLNRKLDEERELTDYEHTLLAMLTEQDARRAQQEAE